VDGFGVVSNVKVKKKRRKKYIKQRTVYVRISRHEDNEERKRDEKDMDRIYRCRFRV